MSHCLFICAVPLFHTPLSLSAASGAALHVMSARTAYRAKRAAAAGPAAELVAVPAIADSASAGDLTLVLGMAFVRDSFPTASASGTTVAVLRDRTRLCALEAAGYSVVSANDTHTAEQCLPHSHCHVTFTRRAVSSVRATLSQLAGEPGRPQQLAAIYGDYFRFPSAYMEKAYAPFLRDMLPELISQGLMGSHTQLILPNLADLQPLFIAAAGVRYPRPDGLPHCGLTVRAIPAEDYPLWVITEALPANQLHVFGGYTHAQQTQQLHPTHPFVLIALATAAEEAHLTAAISAETRISSNSSKRTKRCAAARATAVLMAPHLRVCNFAPGNLSSYVPGKQGQQFYWSPQAWSVGLDENCKLLDTQVAVSQQLSCGRAGLGLFAQRVFAEGHVLGYLWGRFATLEEWSSIKNDKKELYASTSSEIEEDFVAPVLRGVHRCINVPLQANGASLLLASEQCPMAYMNDGLSAVRRNAAIQVPETSFSEADQPAYQYLPCVVRTHDGRGIAQGEEILTDYGWDPSQLKAHTATYTKYLAKHRLAFAVAAAATPTAVGSSCLEDLQTSMSHSFNPVGSGSAAAASASSVATTVTSASPLSSEDSASSNSCGPVTSVPLSSTRFRLLPPHPFFGGNPYSALCTAWCAVAELTVQQLLEQFASETVFMRNGGEQSSVPVTHPLRSDTEACMRFALHCFIGAEAADQLNLVSIAQLRTAPNDGPIPVHTDLRCMTRKERLHAARCFAVILFPHDCQSSILPRLTDAEQEEAMKSTEAFRRLCCEENFFTCAVAAGTMLVFRGDLLHAAPKNRSGRRRAAIYGMFSPTKDQSQFDYASFIDRNVVIDLKLS